MCHLNPNELQLAHVLISSPPFTCFPSLFYLHLHALPFSSLFQSSVPSHHSHQLAISPTHAFTILHIKGHNIIISGGNNAKASAPQMEEEDGSGDDNVKAVACGIMC